MVLIILTLLISLLIISVLILPYRKTINEGFAEEYNTPEEKLAARQAAEEITGMFKKINRIDDNNTKDTAFMDPINENVTGIIKNLPLSLFKPKVGGLVLPNLEIETSLPVKKHEPKVEETPPKEKNCDCDCEYLRSQVDNQCYDYQRRLKQCEVDLSGANARCVEEKNRLALEALAKQEEFEKKIRELNMKNTNLFNALIRCNSRSEIIMNQNKQLARDNASLRKDIITVNTQLDECLYPKTLACRDLQTQSAPDSDGNVRMLVAHALFCGENETLKHWRLVPDGADNIHLNYTCCKVAGTGRPKSMNVAETIEEKVDKFKKELKKEMQKQADLEEARTQEVKVLSDEVRKQESEKENQQNAKGEEEKRKDQTDKAKAEYEAEKKKESFVDYSPFSIHYAPFSKF